MLEQSQEGKEYLEKCWSLQQTEPDLDVLRNKFMDNPSESEVV